MARADDLRSLRERVLAATGPDRELDAEIDAALFGGRASHTFTGQPTAELARRSYSPGTVFRHADPTFNGGVILLDETRLAAPVTGSLDAAVALCERIFPEGRGSVDFGDWSGARVVAYLWGVECPGCGLAATPALALVAACLSAKIAEMETGNGH